MLGNSRQSLLLLLLLLLLLQSGQRASKMTADSDDSEGEASHSWCYSRRPGRISIASLPSTARTLEGAADLDCVSRLIPRSLGRDGRDDDLCPEYSGH